MKRTKRGVIKQLVNRDKAYRLSDYRRKASKLMGRQYSMYDIAGALTKMAREGQLVFTVADNGKVYGCLTKGEKAYQMI